MNSNQQKVSSWLAEETGKEKEAKKDLPAFMQDFLDKAKAESAPEFGSKKETKPPTEPNANQRKVLIGVIVAIVAMLLYPPYNNLMGAGIVRNAGYSWIFDAPSRYSTVNVSLLSIQCIAVAFVGAILYFVLKDKN